MATIGGTTDMIGHHLVENLDTSAAAPLRAALLERIGGGQPLLLDGADVMRVGIACLQVLASAQAAAAANGLSYAIRSPSEPLRNMATLAGLDAVLHPIT